MATVITSIAVSRPDDTASAIDYAASAGTACLERAGLGPCDVDVLINVGVYRDANTIEPAIAALVQKRIGINLDYMRAPDKRAAFSFDLMNGACGMLNAVQAAGALLSTVSARRVLVVSADTHPSMDVRRAGTDEFPYASTGAALLLERTDDHLGFGRVQHRSLPGPFGVNGHLPLREVGPDGRNTIVIDRDEDAVDRMLDFAVDSARSCLDAERVGHAALEGTLLISSQPSPDFACRLAERLGLAADSAVTVQGLRGDPHTSALVYGLSQAQDARRLAGYERILFLTVGAGLSSAAAVYRLPVAAEGAGR
ncbi:hypothetical protein [Streptomyces violascens]|uniref:hypothetical protein n=1 Tax=Streptomyces violascens TaxID=67381 RepID=UPI0036C2354C